jgi:hypothetical protein
MSRGSVSTFELDDSLWPLVVVTFPPHATEADWLSMFAIYERLYARRERFHIVNDGTRVRSVPTPAERKTIGANTERHEADSRRWIIGSAIAVANPIVRGALTALAWLTPPVYKLTYHSKMVECIDEALATFEKQGVPVTDAMRSLRERYARDAG